MIENRYSPCYECLNRYGRAYSTECDNTCEYANGIKRRDEYIEGLEEKLEKKDAELREEKSRVAKLIAQNAKLDYDLGYAYQTISKLRGE